MPAKPTLLSSIEQFCSGDGEETLVRKTNDRDEHPVQGRILARRLADELMNIPAGGLGPTTTATNGGEDITNGTSDNDGPHVPPPI